MHMFSCLGYFLYSVHTTVSARFSKSIQNLNFPNTMYEFQAQMHLHVHTQFANWIVDVHIKFQKKTQAQWINVHFAWRPRWTTAEQVHKGAHTYTSAHNALHTCTTCAFMHCSDRIAHVSMCDATRLFTHAHSCPLGINTSNSNCELYSRVAHAIWNACLRIGFIKKQALNIWSAYYGLDVHDKWRPMDGCRPGADQVQTKWTPGREWPRSPLGLHMVHTWSANWSPWQTTVTTVIITITAMIIIVVIIIIIAFFTKSMFQMHVFRWTRNHILNCQMHLVYWIHKIYLRFQVHVCMNCIRMSHNGQVVDKGADQV